MIKLVVHTFTMGDVEDISLYVATPLYEWEQSESGKWVMEHALEVPYWQESIGADTWGYRIAIVATLKDEDATYFRLKWGNL